MYYSKSTGGFYDATMELPEDAVAITDARYRLLLDSQSAGKAIVANKRGYPISVDPAPPDTEQLRATALASLRVWEQTERTAGISYNEHLWLTTPNALQDIRDALLADIVPGDIWIDAAKNIVPMTMLELRGLWAACVGRGAEIFQRRLQMEAEIMDMKQDQLAAFLTGQLKATVE
ncbi:DUF4376 domain-containing protein [Silvimonas sp.]|uniref:DUF4376 domain-containing protein n=1 Tax=Silvimonas sp. TaxID=2650811 RepID=UPI00284C0AC7|nr:DUF4376 domain-containing protein [Silvimonas sp.]MDR3429015.1 DUF4376 domain-containing protein [Silvimonas sp.]